MQDPNKMRKKRGKLYFNSKKALKTSRMGKKKLAIERQDTNGTNIVLDLEETEENATLSIVDESQGPTSFWERGSQSRGDSKEMGTQCNPASTPATHDHSAEEEFEETSLMEPEGAFLKP